jgi:hypothetical protein
MACGRLRSDHPRSVRAAARIAVVFVVLFGGCGGSAFGAGVSWSSRMLIDHQPPFSSPEALGPIACPGAGLCVAGDGVGVVTSTDPAGGAGAWTPTSFAGLVAASPFGGNVSGVSCPGVRFCAVIDRGGDVLVSSDPTGGPSAWTATKPFAGLQRISCPTAHLCVGISGVGIESSTDPTGGPRHWKLVQPAGSLQLTSISCPSVRLCVVVGSSTSAGAVLASTSPTGGAKTWKIRVPRTRFVDYHFSNVSCPSVHLCAIGTPNRVVTSTHPGARMPHWKVTRAEVDDNLTCRTTRLCVSVSGTTVTASTDPTGGAATWQSTQLPATVGVAPSLACGSVVLCVAVDASNEVLSATAPAAGAQGWQIANLGQGYTQLTAVSCYAATTCLAIDQAGNAVVSSDPASGPSSWHVSPLTAGAKAVSCTTGLCAVATDASVLTFTGGAWKTTALPIGGVNSISCPSANLCAISDTTGRLLVSSDPTGGAGTWTTTILGGSPGCDKYGCAYDQIYRVSCPTANMCAATDGLNLWASTNPTSGASAWIESPLPTDTGFYLTCPSASMCVVATSTTIYATTDPTDPTPHWTTSALPQVEIPTLGPEGTATSPISPLISGISCVSTSLCVAIDHEGGYALSGDPTGGPWTATEIDFSRSNPIIGPQSLTDISCHPNGRCVAVDGLGYAFIGQTN